MRTAHASWNIISEYFVSEQPSGWPSSVRAQSSDRPGRPRPKVPGSSPGRPPPASGAGQTADTCRLQDGGGGRGRRDTVTCVTCLHFSAACNGPGPLTIAGHRPRRLCPLQLHCQHRHWMAHQHGCSDGTAMARQSRVDAVTRSIPALLPSR